MFNKVFVPYRGISNLNIIPIKIDGYAFDVFVPSRGISNLNK